MSQREEIKDWQQQIKDYLKRSREMLDSDTEEFLTNLAARGLPFDSDVVDDLVDRFFDNYKTHLKQTLKFVQEKCNDNRA